MSESLTVNGVPLDSLAFMVTDISGLLSTPNLRGENVVVPGRHGRIRTPRKRFDEAEIVLPMWVVGALRDGGVPVGSSEVEEFFARRDELLRLFYADRVVLEFTRPDGHAVNASCEVADVLDFTRVAAAPLAKVAVALRIPAAFWQDSVSVSQTVSGPTGTTQPLTAFDGATAPMSDLLVTFTGPVNNPMIAHGSRWVKYNGVVSSGRQLVLNTETWQLSPGTGTPWVPDVRQVEFGDGPNWLELNPAVTPFEAQFSHTGGGSASMTISGRRKYLTI